MTAPAVQGEGHPLRHSPPEPHLRALQWLERPLRLRAHLACRLLGREQGHPAQCSRAPAANALTRIHTLLSDPEVGQYSSLELGGGRTCHTPRLRSLCRTLGTGGQRGNRALRRLDLELVELRSSQAGRHGGAGALKGCAILAQSQKQLVPGRPQGPETRPLQLHDQLRRRRRVGPLF